ncbi:MAG: hypothetical protein C4335_14940 [Armatimonadota bacterium]
MCSHGYTALEQEGGPHPAHRLDVLRHYDVDGTYFDYIRFAGNRWGYNPVSVSRFNSATGRTGQPAYNDSTWSQWRRDQVTLFDFGILVRNFGLSGE